MRSVASSTRQCTNGIRCAQVEKVQGLRTDTVKDNLLVYIDSLWKDSNDMFDMHVRNLATEKLATAEYGPMMLTTLGKVYRLQAKRAQGNFAAYFKYDLLEIAAPYLIKKPDTMRGTGCVQCVDLLVGVCCGGVASACWVAQSTVCGSIFTVRLQGPCGREVVDTGVCCGGQCSRLGFDDVQSCAGSKVAKLAARGPL